MKFFCFTISILFSVSLLANPIHDHKEGRLSRRRFLGSLLGAGAVAVVNPLSSVVGSGFGAVNLALPEALKRHIVRLRLKTISVVGESASGQVVDPFLGLKNYIKLLEELALDPSNVNYNSALLSKLKAAKQSLFMFEQAYLKSMNVSSESLDSKSGKSTSSTHRSQIDISGSNSFEAGEENYDFLRAFEHLPVDVRIIAIRSMLGVSFIQKMSWQIHYSGLAPLWIDELYDESFGPNIYIDNPSVILTEEDYKLLQQYNFYLFQTLDSLLKEKTFLNSKGMLEGFENISMAELLLNQFIDESELAIQSYKIAQNLDIQNLREGRGLCYGYLNH